MPTNNFLLIIAEFRFFSFNISEFGVFFVAIFFTVKNCLVSGNEYMSEIEEGITVQLVLQQC